MSPRGERVVVVGRGKAGGSLLASLQAAGVDVVVVSARASGFDIKTRQRLEHPNTKTASRRLVPKRLQPTLVLLCVPDRVVSGIDVDVADDVLVCHVAGSLGLGALKAGRRGVFHPLASLDGKTPVPRGCLCAFDADDDDDAARLQRLAKRLGLSPCRVRDADRSRYHAGAVIAGNLATALLQLGIEQLEQAGVDSDVARVSLARLLASTAARSIRLPLDEALTGPVARGDDATLAAHLGAIDDAMTREVYRLLSGVLIDRVVRNPKGDERDDDDAVDKEALRRALGLGKR